MAIILYVASLLKKSSKVNKKKQFAFKRFNKKNYLNSLMKTQVAKTKEIIKIDSCNVII